MSKDIGKNLHDAERAMNRLRNKFNKVDSDYVVQISISSVDPSTVKYAASLTAPANGLQPVAFIADSAQDLVKQIKAFTKSVDYKMVELAYHKAQIESCYRTIRGHEDRIKELEEEKEETDGDTEENSSEE